MNVLTQFLIPVVFAGCLDAAETPSTPPAATSISVLLSDDLYPNGKILADAAQLEALRSSGKLRILDVRAADAFQKGHIPSAVPVDVEAMTKRSRAPGALTDAAFWSKTVGTLGIDAETTVVVVDDTVTPNAARVWWLLRYVGVADVRLLNGGFAAWKALGREASTASSAVSEAKFEPKFQSRMLANAETVRTMIDQPGKCLIDSRTAAEYSGEQVQGPRGGRVPSAKHLEWKQFLDERGRFKSATAITKLLSENRLAADDTAITYCQSGGRASLDVFALELMGFKDVRNYYGSWSEWSANEALPVVKGP
jgi:thiosulfate/3-mercaptopyruvate sulfurtransferase